MDHLKQSRDVMAAIIACSHVEAMNAPLRGYSGKEIKEIFQSHRGM